MGEGFLERRQREFPFFLPGSSIQSFYDRIRLCIDAAGTPWIKAKFAALRIRRFGEYGPAFGGGDEEQSALTIKGCILPINSAPNTRPRQTARDCNLCVRGEDGKAGRIETARPILNHEVHTPEQLA